MKKLNLSTKHYGAIDLGIITGDMLHEYQFFMTTHGMYKMWGIDIERINSRIEAQKLLDPYDLIVTRVVSEEKGTLKFQTTTYIPSDVCVDLTRLEDDRQLYRYLMGSYGGDKETNLLATIRIRVRLGLGDEAEEKFAAFPDLDKAPCLNYISRLLESPNPDSYLFCFDDFKKWFYPNDSIEFALEDCLSQEEENEGFAWALREEISTLETVIKVDRPDKLLGFYFTPVFTRDCFERLAHRRGCLEAKIIENVGIAFRSMDDYLRGNAGNELVERALGEQFNRTEIPSSHLGYAIWYFNALGRIPGISEEVTTIMNYLVGEGE